MQVAVPWREPEPSVEDSSGWNLACYPAVDVHGPFAEFAVASRTGCPLDQAFDRLVAAPPASFAAVEASSTSGVGRSSELPFAGDFLLERYFAPELASWHSSAALNFALAGAAYFEYSGFARASYWAEATQPAYCPPVGFVIALAVAGSLLSVRA